MTRIMRNSWLLLAVTLFLVPSGFAQQNIHHVPEGGSDLMYLALAGMSCFGAIFYRVRR